MKRRLTMAILLLTLAAQTFSCGGTDKPSDTTDSTHSEDTTVAPATMLDSLADVNYNGYEFNIFGALQWVGSDYFYRDEETGDVIEDAVFKRNRTVEERYNVDLKFSLIDDYNDSVKTLRTYIESGDDTYDLLTSPHLFLGPLIVSRYFADWKEVPSVDLTLDCYIDAANSVYSIGDSMPLLFGDFMETNTLRCWNFVFNKRLAEENSLGDIYSAVDEGKWTIDYFNNLIKDISKDLDGNTVMDENDFYGFSTDRLATLDAFSRPCGIFAVTKNSDNLPELSFMNDNTVKAFEAVYNLYYNCPGTFSTKENVWHIENMFAESKSVFAAIRMDFMMNEKVRAMKDDYGVLPYPKLTEEQEYTTYLSGTYSAQMIPVTQPSGDYERTGIITQALNAYGHEYVIPEIFETTLKNKLTRDEDSVRMLKLITESRAYSFDSCDESNFPLSPASTFRNLIGSKKSDIASYYAKNVDKAQAWITSMVTAWENS